MDKEKHFHLLITLHIIAGTIGLIMLLLGRMFIGVSEPFLMDAINDFAPQAAAVFKFLMEFIRLIGYFYLIGMVLPSLLGAIALTQSKRWGLYLLVISGGIRIINFPLGTVLGIYTLWIYFNYKN